MKPLHTLFVELLSWKIDAVSYRASCRGRSSVNDTGKIGVLLSLSVIMGKLLK